MPVPDRSQIEALQQRAQSMGQSRPAAPPPGVGAAPVRPRPAPPPAAGAMPDRSQVAGLQQIAQQVRPTGPKGPAPTMVNGVDPARAAQMRAQMSGSRVPGMSPYAGQQTKAPMMTGQYPGPMSTKPVIG